VRAFITGIAGFAGSHLAEHLLASGDEVLGSSCQNVWNDDAPALLRHTVPLARWNIAEPISPESLQQIADFRPDVVFHLAAVSIPADCGQQEPTSHAWQVNVVGTERVVEMAGAIASRPRVLVVSSCRVYGRLDPKQLRVAETALLQPTNGYGKTKLAAEQALWRKCDAFKLEGLVIRAFNHAGPRQSPRLMLSEWCQQFARGDNPVRVHCLDSYLDMSDVRDVVRAYRMLALAGKPGEAYNVGGGVPLRSGDIFEQLRQICAPERPTLELAPGRRQDPIADLTKIQSTINWRPDTPLTATLRDTLDYWLARTARPN
jgi:GDP-4-dehydro-6-deoxy-D-mannose reductase